ncbi:MAG: hypothetical protein HQK83_19965 [Fibrobacteria bacterium]|nr:hypothetical protein [Fibrobacteria bacterium]
MFNTHKIAFYSFLFFIEYMGERLIITKLEDLKKVTHITRILASIPNLTAGVIRNQMHSLPWMLPDIQDHQKLETIKANLEALGCSCKLQYLETRAVRPKITKPEDVPKPNERTLDAMAEKLKKDEPTITPTLKARHTEEISIPAKSIGTKTNITKSVKSLKKRRVQQIVTLSIILLLCGGIFWVGMVSRDKKISSKNDKTKSMQSRSSKLLTQEKNRRKQHAKDVYEKARQREDLAHSYYNKALTEGLPKQKIDYLKKTVKNNPYHREAWNELIRLWCIMAVLKRSSCSVRLLWNWHFKRIQKDL